MHRPSVFLRLVSLSLAVAICLCAGTADAQFGGKKKKGGGNRKPPPQTRMIEDTLPYAQYEAKGLFPTGLRAVFPKGADCPPISSPYGSKTRFDGSPRNNDHYGYHNGMDITLEPGTPLLSVADGEVIHTGSAGQLVGNFIWLHYPPQSTGLGLHVFARYQHLDRPPTLAVGSKTRAGDPVGPAGNTGTIGGHYGRAGYSHLHLVFYTGPTGEFTVNGPMVGPKTLNYLDPLALYVAQKPPAASNAALRALPAPRKAAAVPVQLQNGKRMPADATVVWPVACAAR